MSNREGAQTSSESPEEELLTVVVRRGEIAPEHAIPLQVSMRGSTCPKSVTWSKYREVILAAKQESLRTEHMIIAELKTCVLLGQS